MDAVKLDSIVAKMYSGASGRLPWDAALNELAHSADAWAIHILGLNKRTGGILFSHHGGAATPQTNLDYIRTYHRIDPRTPLAAANKSEPWFHCHEHFDDRYAASSPFYQDFLIPYGGRYMSIGKIVDDEDLVVMMGVHRGLHKAPLDSEAILWLDRIRIHLTEGMAIYRHLRELHYERAAGRQLLDRLVHPIILVDAMRGILFRNRAAAEALESTDYILDRSGMLGCRHATDDAALTAAIRELHLQADPTLQLPPRRKTVRLHCVRQRGRVAAYVSALRPQDVMGAFGSSSIVLLVFHDATATATPDPFILGEAFELTPAEARVAIELAQGKTAEDVSVKRSVAIGTIRAQIKSLFEKTGVHHQGDLVRVILSTPLV